MRILLTGGAGFIGSHIADAAIQAGHTVAVVDDLSTGSADNLNPDVRLYRVSVTDAGELAKVFAAEKPEVVNHHAAQTDVRRSMSDPAFDAGTNVLGTVEPAAGLDGTQGLQVHIRLDGRRLLGAAVRSHG